jgi:hypothetical protein
VIPAAAFAGTVELIKAATKAANSKLDFFTLSI